MTPHCLKLLKLHSVKNPTTVKCFDRRHMKKINQKRIMINLLKHNYACIFRVGIKRGHWYKMKYVVDDKIYMNTVYSLHLYCLNKQW